MATSADTLARILDVICRENSLDVPAVKKLLIAHDLLPKKLIDSPKAKKAASPWASKAAEELAAHHLPHICSRERPVTVFYYFVFLVLLCVAGANFGSSSMVSSSRQFFRGKQI